MATILEQKSKEVKVLDETTRELLASIEHKDKRSRQWQMFAFSALLLVGVIGIYKQNQIAGQSKKHIDCIIKDLATPPPKNASPNAKKYIDIRSTLSSDCSIKFTQ